MLFLMGVAIIVGVLRLELVPADFNLPNRVLGLFMVRLHDLECTSVQLCSMPALSLEYFPPEVHHANDGI